MGGNLQVQWQTLREQVQVQLGDTGGVGGVVVPLVWLALHDSVVGPVDATVLACSVRAISYLQLTV